jgi:parvulin-like peptidyl-prolyl isomerase
LGFHLIKVLDSGSGGAKPVENTREEIKAFLHNEAYQKEVKKMVDDLKKSAHIDIRM